MRGKTAPSDVVIELDDGFELVTQHPIEGLTAAPYRQPLLLFHGSLYELTHVSDGAGGTRYRFRTYAERPYEIPGATIAYDPNRLSARRRERWQTVVAVVIGLLSMPLLPVIGLLPQSVKDRLLLPTVSSGASLASLMVEGGLFGVATVAFGLLGGPLSLHGAVLGAIAVFLGADLAHRFVGINEGRSPGLGAIVVETIARIKERRADTALFRSADTRTADTRTADTRTADTRAKPLDKG